ncbi:MAG: insulinase family protein [Xanthobacteraceae bacterium]|nr:insulinase family protein [Xanthobacteraceae bacterium]
MTVRIDKLENGVTVATDTMPDVKTASLGIWAAAGARYEDGNEHGISHLLEHMAFKGTSKRSALQISEEIENVGGELNAATGIEVTSYYARVLGKDIPLAFDILSDILTNSTFELSELGREQSVIVQEIGGAADDPDDIVFDLFQETAFPGQPIGRPILGTPETVRSFTPEKLRAYMAKRYRGARMIVAAAGAVNHEALLAAASESLASVPGGEVVPATKANYAGGIHIHPRKLEQTHLVLGLEGISYHAPERFSMQAFVNLTGGGGSSRLFQEVRERRGLCYSIQAFHSFYQDVGLFGVTAGADAADAEELTRVVIAELHEAAEKATQAEVDRAKAQMKVGLLSALESASVRADQLGSRLLAFGRAIPFEEIERNIEAVTLESVRSAGRRLVGGGRPTFVGIGEAATLERAGAATEALQRKAA